MLICLVDSADVDKQEKQLDDDDSPERAQPDELHDHRVVHEDVLMDEEYAYVNREKEEVAELVINILRSTFMRSGGNQVYNIHCVE